jgi:para-nitrobenzyl esterase
VALAGLPVFRMWSTYNSTDSVLPQVAGSGVSGRVWSRDGCCPPGNSLGDQMQANAAFAQPEIRLRPTRRTAVNAKRVALLLFFALFAVASTVGGSPAIAASDQSIVITERGPIWGVSTLSLRKFLGIPYAAPPIGALRWRPPEDHVRWFTPLNASRFGNHCPQDASVFGTASSKEDCLFLNIFAPYDEAKEADYSSNYPVMVWIHGGALTVGESDDYIPTKLVRQGKVIVVTINYRLGALGFLAHPALTAESQDHISGNYGIMDQQFALKWLQRNIAAFGGDPQNVTIFGESAGGLSVLSHLASPKAAGLFHRAIVESGAYELSLPAMADEESHGEVFAAGLECNDQSARCLRSKSVEEIVANWGLFDSNPNVDGKVLPRSLDAAFTTGQFNHVPVMHGTNHDEWRFFVSLSFDLAGGSITAEQYPAVVEGMVGPDAAPLVLAGYPLESFASPDLAVGAIGTDSIFACPARIADQALSTQVPTFTYEFNDINAPEVFLPPVSFPYGATHASELLYLFELTWPGRLDAQQHKLSESMIRYWTQFAKAGDPNSSGVPFWRQYDATIDEFQSLAPRSPVSEFGFASDHKCDFWATLFGANTQDAAQ